VISVIELTQSETEDKMAISNFAKEYHEKMFLQYSSELAKTDPEFVELFDNFAFDEVINMPEIGGKEVDGRTRHMAILATLLGCQGIDEFKSMLLAAINFGVTPVEIKEIVYQAVAYLGIGRVFPFLNAVNEFLTEQGIALPLEGQSQTTTDNRLEKGSQAQGGCEPQLTSHAAANMKNGNDKLFLIKIISHCLPFIGYPRSLNALRCVNEAAKI
jgi:4-carboxymuconolactone decarboxylase